MTILDGKKIAQDLMEELRVKVERSSKKPKLAIIRVGADGATDSFLKIKKQTGEKIGIEVRIFAFADDITTNNLRKRIADIVNENKNTAVIIQLPLPGHINTQYILNSVTPDKDADMLSARALGNFITGKSLIFPPVAGAVKKILDKYNIEYRSKNILIVGAGRLVGRGVFLWLSKEDVGFSVVTKNTADLSSYVRNADILISGAGHPHLITGDMIKEGAVVIDAGLSELNGKTVGDVDFESASSKASYITPIPGGVGPLVVAMLFNNVVILQEQEK
ncbi:MAG: bifunctional methylenetetrahydrofolate dehydrogenase/methenyltetrahydrofolate cyclohydrolase [Candidatus Niyogibacteria bacterium CG10_big_fil_rev_8_21_14_0_10_42_19]|uniref:Bifunctional protein FolD n=1 Tax=Candidatus Niyogibacteria bacterium CG10_big_fil_rev_8_21_14_0_10_42_19 TaxID=1974725 RepID=A0A2H0TI48_9BACT|nr:MAG: bifunctional methylenetetrahydrofolate dehydrogenase/methenyltetrahydrofolate cyclohydrolase [Candidatus Niyogibacteria bacterium CG10_big_fil_rev_8_21_14_0_10_42_19]